jgi:hypothetical protein
VDVTLVDLSVHIYRGTTREEQHEKVNHDPVSGCFVDSSLKNGQTYYYVVTAADFAGMIPASEMASATPSILPPAGFTVIGDDSKTSSSGGRQQSISPRIPFVSNMSQGQNYQKLPMFH